MNSNTNLPIEEQMDKLRLKCFKDLVELARLDKDWNPDRNKELVESFGEVEQ